MEANFSSIKGRRCTILRYEGFVFKECCQLIVGGLPLTSCITLATSSLLLPGWVGLVWLRSIIVLWHRSSSLSRAAMATYTASCRGIPHANLTINTQNISKTRNLKTNESSKDWHTHIHTQTKGMPQHLESQVLRIQSNYCGGLAIGEECCRARGWKEEVEGRRLWVWLWGGRRVKHQTCFHRDYHPHAGPHRVPGVGHALLPFILGKQVQ